jgi:photosystem II stability/assembly factor-like uncharacterized protein
LIPAGQAPAPTVHLRAPTGLLQSGAEWTELLSGVAVSRLFAPSSGALLASTADDLLRSDNAGETWSAISLPERKPGSVITVDPTNHDTLYVAANDGIQRSSDAGATWTTILPSARPTFQFHRIAVSPADPRFILAAQYGANDFWLYRSLDGGASWEQIDELHASLCGMNVYILTQHPADPARVFRTAGCYAGRSLGDDVQESRDFGSSWSKAFTSRTAFPRSIVGGAGADPLRFYLAVNNDSRSGGSLLLTSADDGATWTTVLEHSGGGTMQGAKAPSTVITSLTYDPATPQRVFLAQQEKAVTLQGVGTHFVSGSGDGGASWSLLGRQQLPQINQLALGIDGRYVFAATEQGVMRIAVG